MISCLFAIGENEMKNLKYLTICFALYPFNWGLDCAANWTEWNKGFVLVVGPFALDISW